MSEAALDLLAHAESYPGLEPIASPPLLRLFRFDGLGPYVSWSVFRDGARHRVRRVIWDRRRDAPFGPPSTFGADALVDSAVIDARIASVRALPHEPQRRFGVDGCHYGIELTGPEPWKAWWWSGDLSEDDPLWRWFDELVEALELILPA